MKLGARGVLVGVGPGELHQVSLPPVTPVDTTGAGDCFNAGLIAGLLRGLPLPEAAALGCATGALSTGALGGTAGAPGWPKATDLAAHAVIELPASLATFQEGAPRQARPVRWLLSSHLASQGHFYEDFSSYVGFVAPSPL